MTGPTLKSRALRLLAMREHSRAELERKLRPFECEPGELAQALDVLDAKGFINEARVVESVLHRRAAKLGTARVLQELRDKGLGGDLVEAAATQLHQTEGARAREVWRRKFGVPAHDAPTRAKHMRFLASRGFSAQAIRDAMDAEFDELTGDPPGEA